MVKEKGLSTDGGKEGMLAALAFHSRGGMSGESASVGAHEDDTLPTNLHSLSVPMLRSLCASRGIHAPEGCAKDDLIEKLENCDERLKMLEEKPIAKAAGEDEEEDGEEEDGEEAFVPEVGDGGDDDNDGDEDDADTDGF